MSRSISGLFLSVNCKKWILSKFSDSLFDFNHLFKNSNSIFVLLLKSSKLELINITIVTHTSGTGLNLSLIDLIDLLCTGEEVKV
jgi:hypothetical protein